MERHLILVDVPAVLAGVCDITTRVFVTRLVAVVYAAARDAYHLCRLHHDHPHGGVDIHFLIHSINIYFIFNSIEAPSQRVCPPVSELSSLSYLITTFLPFTIYRPLPGLLTLRPCRSKMLPFTFSLTFTLLMPVASSPNAKPLRVPATEAGTAR